MGVGLLGKKILVIGANALLGSSYVDQNKKDELKCFSFNSNKYDKLDITSFSDIQVKTKDLEFEYIINFSGLTDIDICQTNQKLAYDINCKGVRNLSSLCQIRDSKLIHFSTDHLYDSPGYNVEGNIKINNYYSESKYLGELEALKCQSLILRTNFFGKSHSAKKSFSDLIIQKALHDGTLNIFNDVYFNPLRIKTVIKIINSIINKRSKIYGIFNLGSRNGMSKADFIKEMLNIKKISCELNNISVDNFLKKRSKLMMMNVAKFEDAFEIELPTLIEEINNEF